MNDIELKKYYESLYKNNKFVAEIRRVVAKLKIAEKNKHHCKATVTIYEHYNSYIIDHINKFLNNRNMIYTIDKSNKYWVTYNMLELPTQKIKER